MYYAPVDSTGEFMVTRPVESLIARELGLSLGIHEFLGHFLFVYA